VSSTGKEFDLFLQFAQHPGRVYTRAQLLDLVWGYGHEGYEHTVNAHINRLRTKIERDPRHPRYVLTVWGVGYKFTDRAVPTEASPHAYHALWQARRRTAWAALSDWWPVPRADAGHHEIVLSGGHAEAQPHPAQHLVAENMPLRGGQVDSKALQDMFHLLMVINPSIEVYLLDPQGTIPGLFCTSRPGPTAAGGPGTGAPVSARQQHMAHFRR
jgi:DNA-binding winged helix-turn-helix (wHTH) protein